MEHLQQLDACRPTGHNQLPPGLREINTPLGWREWDQLLAPHPDQQFRSYIVEGIKYGFRVGFNYSYAMSCKDAKCNMSSALDNPQVVREYLALECSEGRVLGPLVPAQFPQVHVSRFGVIPKGSSGKWRLIVDLSAPEGHSVNDGVAETLCSMSYSGISDAVRGVLKKGQGVLMAKLDIKSAYRNIPVHPDDRWLLGMLWDDSLFVDSCLPFGLRSAPKIFSAVADALEWIVRSEGVDFIIHYLDDFFIVGDPASHECASALSTLIDVCNRLGFPVALEKLEGPTCQLTFLGFELDSRSMEIRVPTLKLTELRQLLHSWGAKKACSRRDLESLVGKLAHVSRVIPPGKTFMRRMFELLHGVRQAHHHIRLGISFRSDLAWWVMFMDSWNGVSMMPAPHTNLSVHHIWTDASGHFGCGAICPLTGSWLQFPWPHHGAEGNVNLKQESITLKELLSIVFACAVWGNQWQRSMIIAHCDNQSAVEIVNSGCSRIPAIMHLMRCLFFIRAHFQISVRAEYVPGAHNTIADAISRNNLCLLFTQVPLSVNKQVVIPRELVSLLAEQQPDWTSPTWTKLFRSCFPPA